MAASISWRTAAPPIRRSRPGAARRRRGRSLRQRLRGLETLSPYVQGCGLPTPHSRHGRERLAQAAHQHPRSIPVGGCEPPHRDVLPGARLRLLQRRLHAIEAAAEIGRPERRQLQRVQPAAQLAWSQAEAAQRVLEQACQGNRSEVLPPPRRRDRGMRRHAPANGWPPLVMTASSSPPGAPPPARQRTVGARPARRPAGRLRHLAQDEGAWPGPPPRRWRPPPR